MADTLNNRVCFFKTSTGTYVGQLTGVRRPLDLHPCEGGWLVACFGSHSIEQLPWTANGGGSGVCPRASLGLDWAVAARVRPLDRPTGVVLVPGLGLVVREWGGCRFRVLE